MQRPGIFKCERSTFLMLTCVKKVRDAAIRGLFWCNNVFLFCFSREIKRRNWISKSLFATCYYSGVYWGSFAADFPPASLCWYLSSRVYYKLLLLYCYISSDGVYFSSSPTKPGYFFVFFASFHQQSLCFTRVYSRCSLILVLSSLLIMLVLFLMEKLICLPGARGHIGSLCSAQCFSCLKLINLSS